jgi:hypothetical protein
MPPAFAAVLYALCSALLLGAAFLVWLKDPRTGANRAFALTALALLAWLLTLLAFNRTQDPGTALLVGRLNFAAVAPAAFTAYLFVRAVAGLPKPRAYPVLAAGTALLALLSTLTPLIDAAEQVGDGVTGRHMTVYGPLWPLYLLHVAGLLLAAVSLAFHARRDAPPPQRDQLGLVGAGMLATGTVALVANALLPYAAGDFRFIDAGPLSTVLFLAAVAYAVVRHRLFDVRVFVRRTLVASLLLSFVLAAYGAVVALATERFAGPGQGALTRFGVLFIAAAFDPLRRFLERRVDDLLSAPPRRRRQARARHTA